MTREQILEQYVQELTSHRAHLEYQIIQLKAEIAKLNGPKPEGPSTVESAQ